MVKTAVILAAGNGERLRSEEALPKPLIKIGGLRLIERVILNFKHIGVTRFRVVLGAYQEEIIKGLRKTSSLKKLNIEFVRCENFHVGNGASLGAGVAGLKEAFYLSMADHVMEPKIYQDFSAQLQKSPESPLLAVDENLDEVFDMDDATKVATSTRGQIVALSKELDDFKYVDTGLFYFPENVLPMIRQTAAEGVRSVSEFVLRISEESGFFVHSIPKKLFWQDVDTPEMAHEAEERLLRSLTKETDGWVSKNINRKFSLRISKVLARLKVHPNVITSVVFLVSMSAAVMAASTQYLWVALAGVIFQLCSIVDGCDGEVARLRLRFSLFGAWYDTLTDNIRYAAFIVALALGAYFKFGDPIYLWGIAYFILTIIFMISTMMGYERKVKAGTHLVVTQKIEEEAQQMSGFWKKWLFPLRVLVKQDVSAFIVMFFCLLGLGHYFFWGACVALTLMTLAVVRSLLLPEKVLSLESLRVLARNPFLLFMLGCFLFAQLLNKVSWSEVQSSLSMVGSSYIWVVLFVPVFWFLANSMCLSVLSKGKVKLLDLFQNQVVGESVNALLPLAGLGGEPYKVKHLSQWLEKTDAVDLVVKDRVLHIISGFVFASLLGAASVLFVSELNAQLKTIVLSVSLVFLFCGFLLSKLALSSLPEKLSEKLFLRFRFLKEFKLHSLKSQEFYYGVSYKLVGRAFSFIEVFALIKITGVLIGWAPSAFVMFLLSSTTLLFFIIPQGIGVNEWGVVGAFQLLGLSTPAALAIGVLRRIRVLFWSFLGVILGFVLPFLFKRVRLASKTN